MTLRANQLVVPAVLTLLGLSTLIVGGCATLGYYAQSVGGQMRVLSRAQPIERVLHDPATPAEIRARLAAIQRIRSFAIDELHLPDNGSYTHYADLGRPYVVWNVYATPELSLKPKQWCFPVAGCVTYRGYFDQASAEEYAAALAREGYDVYVAGVNAYSTLGWFRDPVFNSVLRRSEASIAGLIFHELAHQRLYVRDDTAFNESFAMAVELEGARRWLSRDPDRYACPECETLDMARQLEEYLAGKQRHEQFVELLGRARARLEALYASARGAGEQRAGKQQIFAGLREEYALLREEWGGYDGYDQWFGRPLNNAHLASVGIYHQYLPAFQALLEEHAGDLKAFYRDALRIGRLSGERRRVALRSLIGRVAGAATTNS
ncbi:MAG TPA: aminopeptidase [Acidiferrobacterales bacterium]